MWVVRTKSDLSGGTTSRYMRVKLSYLSLKATLLCLRGSRRGKGVVESGEDFNFSLDEYGI